MLEREASKRLGAGPADADDIKREPFFAGLDWDKVTKRGYKPAFKPAVKVLLRDAWCCFVCSFVLFVCCGRFCVCGIDGGVRVQDASDTSNFDEQFTTEKPVDSVVDSRLAETAKKSSNFDGFTFVASSALQKD